jgi:hypothetical protein
MTTRRDATDQAVAWANEADRVANDVRSDVQIEDLADDLPKDTTLRDNAVAMATMWAAVAQALPE